MPFKVAEMAQNAKGGTELMAARLENHLRENNPELLEFFNFHCSRLREYDENKPSVYWCHDLADDPETNHLANGGWQKFDLIVFVSNWQYQQYQEKYKLDGTNCIVIPNAVEPSKYSPDYKWKFNLQNIAEPIKIIYHTTPHRGLELLVPAFKDLWEAEWQHLKNPVTLEVYSSFSIYGWPERDAPYEKVIQECKDHPAINYHGSVSHDEVQQALAKAHIFAYPSIWKETSCLALIEAMQAECICIHPNLGALIETSGDLTVQYPFKTDPSVHYSYFKQILQREVAALVGKGKMSQPGPAAARAKDLYNWRTVAKQWTDILTQVKEAVDSYAEID